MPRGKPERRNIVPPSGATGSKPPPQIIMLPNINPTQGFQGVSRQNIRSGNVIARFIRGGRGRA